MNVLLLGSGGRESALAWKIKQSKHCENLYIAPGNGGTAQFGTNIELAILDFEAIEKFCKEQNIAIIVCGPELPAVHGLWDYFQSHQSIMVIAPSQISAQLEGSKAFAKEFMQKHNIPTAEYIEVTNANIEDGFQWFESKNPPFVIKADGLAEGKGVVIATTKEEAETTLKDFIENQKFGESSAKVVLEEFLDGVEFSMFVFTNGKNYVMLPNAKDYKRRFEGNIGLNTGGMGCISPVPFVDKEMEEKVKSQVIEPTIKGLQEDNMPYFGFIYFGLINVEGQPKVIEYNCRLGDPETEVLMPRLENDILEMFWAGVEHKESFPHFESLKEQNASIENYEVKISSQSCVTVMLASNGYPEAYLKGFEITGLENVKDSIVFHAGTKMLDSKCVTNGGRVMAVSSLGNSLKNALEVSYQSINLIHFQGKVYRNDIGFEFI
jgi:phosphoribosylamine--glycine ligase